MREILAAWQRERPGDDVSSILVVTPIWRLAAALQRARAGALAGFGLDQSRLDVLGALRRAGTPYRLTAGELTRRCRVTPGATTQRVQRLEQHGYVARVRDEDDRRTVYVALTPGGSAKLDEVFAAVLAADERVLAPLSRRDRSALERILGGWLAAAGLDATTSALDEGHGTMTT
ncbi:MarR family transcriptional regulator [Nocardioides sp.]|uniref:MarR family winged helix-turn-helix transcriptional regulator n=1 Tax=Nocardioides sp. TaxID=35761 RepID=UPI002F409708